MRFGPSARTAPGRRWQSAAPTRTEPLAAEWRGDSPTTGCRSRPVRQARLPHAGGRSCWLCSFRCLRCLPVQQADLPQPLLEEGTGCDIGILGARPDAGLHAGQYHVRIGMHEEWHGIAATIAAGWVYNAMGGRRNHVVGHARQHVARIHDEMMRLAWNGEPTAFAIEDLEPGPLRGYKQSKEIDVLVRRRAQTAIGDIG